MAGRHGIDWYPQETNALIDDEKVFDLMEAAEERGEDGFASFGRWVALLCRIYREGPALQLDGRTERKLARDLGMTREALLGFVSQCVESGLLDRGLWERERVLTSGGIQRRWCAAKKRVKALPADMRQWSLLDVADAGDASESRQISANLGTWPEFSEKCREMGDTPQFGAETRQISGLDKKREEEIRREEKREDEKKSSSSSRGLEGSVPACMSATREDGTWFADDADGVYPTIGEALEARYRHRTGLSDFADFVSRVASRCPGGCRGDPERAAQCHALIARALDRYEPSRGSSPLPLALKIIEQDRGF